MIVVVIALMPCVFWGMYNAGLQANLALDPGRGGELVGWRYALIDLLGVGYDPGSVLANLVHGALYFIPLYLVTMVVGGTWEVLFSIVRKHPINEGFFVTGLIFPLILPATTPLWQAAPVDAHSSGQRASRSLPTTPGKLTLSVFGNRSASWPLTVNRGPTALRRPRP